MELYSIILVECGDFLTIWNSYMLENISTDCRFGDIPDRHEMPRWGISHF